MYFWSKAEVCCTLVLAPPTSGNTGAAIEEFLPAWSLAPIVQALQALRGVYLIVAVTFATESPL